MTAPNRQSTPFTNAAIARNFAEYFLIVGVWLGAQALISRSQLSSSALIVILIVLSLSKTAFFGLENIQQLLRASRDNLAYHRFLMLMLINMSQITLSFGLDYHCLHSIDAGSFSSIDPTETMAEQIFDFTFFSILNFTFFGFGDITPQTIPAKMLTVTEIVLAFVTVIFLLSDFISMKESIRS